MLSDYDLNLNSKEAQYLASPQMSFEGPRRKDELEGFMGLSSVLNPSLLQQKFAPGQGRDRRHSSPLSGILMTRAKSKAM